MSIDLAIATPAYIDLTFVGLEALPAPGEERFAADLLRSPGGGAITAVGAARLGLSATLAAPLGRDAAGEFVRRQLERDGVNLVERRSPRTPITVVMPVAGDRSMITVDQGVRASASDIAALEPRAVAASLDQLYCVPDGAAAYVTCGDDDARAFAGRPPAQLAGTRALFVSEVEAVTLTGADTPEAGAQQLHETGVEQVILMRGPSGAALISDGTRLEVEAIVTNAVDPTGAVDLLSAAYIWADLRGADAHDRLRWAVVYAGLSVMTPTATGGAVDEERLLEEGTKRGLTPPAGCR